MEARLLRKDGQYRWFLLRFKPLRDAEGQVARWYGTDDGHIRTKAGGRVAAAQRRVPSRGAKSQPYWELWVEGLERRALLVGRKLSNSWIRTRNPTNPGTHRPTNSPGRPCAGSADSGTGCDRGEGLGPSGATPNARSFGQTCLRSSTRYQRRFRQPRVCRGGGRCYRTTRVESCSRERSLAAA